MGNLDDHDPSLSDDFDRDHEVILFNDTGVASTNGNRRLAVAIVLAIQPG